jgi:MraZ protein
MMLTGEYECKMDERGRVKLPQKLIAALGNRRSYEFVINRGFEKHLILYTREVWQSKTKEIDRLNIYNKKQREVIRYFYRGATELTNDSADRILIPGNLLKYADIDKDVVLFAYQDVIEIWSRDEYEKMLEREPEDFASIAEGIFGSDQNPEGDE